MLAARFCLAVGVALAAAHPAPAQLRAGKPVTVAASSAALLEKIPEPHRDAVAKVLAKPTLTTKAAEESFTVTTAVYSWMLDHPDRVSLAWQRLEVPCVDIVAVGKNQFSWQDDQGSKLVWEPVAKLSDGVVWYATGHVKAGALLPMVPVKAVAVLRHPGVATATAGLSTVTPELEVWFQTDNKAANALLKMIGPAAPKIAEDSAGQLLYFFSGIGKYVQRNPSSAPILLAGK